MPRNRDVARAWFAASGLKAASPQVAALAASAHEGNDLSTPRPAVPSQGATIRLQPDGIELVWTVAPQPERVFFFVELRVEDATVSREVFSTFVETTSVLATVPARAGNSTWRVVTVSRPAKRYVASPWRAFAIAPN